MPKLVGSLKARTIDATTDPVLDGFCCGKKGKRAENEVHKIVGELRSGERPIPEVRVTEEIPPGNLVGLAAVGRIAFQNPRLLHFNGSPYITVIALSDACRGEDARGEGPHLGDFLLADALAVAKRQRRGGMPWVFAYVDEANDPSCALFKRHGFEVVIKASTPQADALFRRPKNLRLREATK